MSDRTYARKTMIWDPALRLFHWALMILVLAAWLLAEFGPLVMTLHFWAGYGVAALLVFRVVWGFWGPRNARFASFLRGPGPLWGHIRALPLRIGTHAAGHNPLGGLAVLAMLLMLAGMVGTGLILDPEDYINTGPLAHLFPAEWNRWALRMHHALGKALLALLALHVAAIAFHRIWKREDLVTPMITGRRR